MAQSKSKNLWIFFWMFQTIKRHRKFIAGATLTGISIAGIAYYSISSAASKIYNSIKPIEPDDEMIEKQKQNTNKNILFRTIPALRNKIAWLSLGKYPTDVDLVKVILPKSDKRISIALKREDLTNESYGGNKVRTLEYQLACAKVLLRHQKHGKLVTLGGGGSNQIVAAAVFCNKHNIPLIEVPFGDEASSFDNGMNFISHMSFSYFEKAHFTLPITTFWSELYAVLFKQNNLIAMPGGANVTGSLGHTHAILELVEQIKQKKLKPPKHIFLALGSSCTTSGLIAGMALIRKLNIGNELYDCKIHAIGIHHAGNTYIGKKLILSLIHKLAGDTLKLIHKLGGVDATGKEFKQAITQLIFTGKHAVKYGKWTHEALLAKAVMGNGEIITSNNPLPWMCSCFSAKAFAAMIQYIEGLNEKESFNTCDESIDGDYLFWCTKSKVQPLFDAYLAKRNVEKLNEVGSNWLKECHINQEQDYLPFVNKLANES
eukprot:175171_1